MKTDSAMMAGAPPAVSQQVSLENWRFAPFNQWAFHHVREIIPTADIRSATPRPFEQDLQSLSAVTFEDGQGRERTFGTVMDESWTTGLVVLHRGQIVTEAYGYGYQGHGPHIVFSISKSITAMIAGILADRDTLDTEALVTHYILEAEGTAYGDCTVQHLLDMTVSCTFEEVYLDPEGDYAQYRAATGWNPPIQSKRVWKNPCMRQFLLSLKKGPKSHGDVFNYLSPNSDMLGWVLERSAGRRFADLMRDLLWQSMGAESAAYITVDPLGAPRTAGGICITVRDLARVGELMRLGGKVGNTRVLPAWWIDDTLAERDNSAWVRGEMHSLFPNGGYRNKWYRTGYPSGAFCGIGIHGQWLFVDPAAEVVIARTAAQPEPVDEPLDLVHLAGFDAVARHLESAG